MLDLTLQNRIDEAVAGAWDVGLASIDGIQIERLPNDRLYLYTGRLSFTFESRTQAASFLNRLLAPLPQ